MLKSILLILLPILFISCSIADAHSPFPQNNTQIKSFNLVGTKKLMEEWEFDTLLSKSINFIAFNPYAFSNLSNSKVIFDQSWQWKGEQSKGIEQHIQIAHQKGIQTGIIPHIWVEHGTFTGTAKWENPKQFFQDYTEFLLVYAQLAEEYNCAFLAIGKELGEVFQSNPTEVNQLIDTIRSIYNGTLTYAANWDEYKHTNIWEKLDVIGINAYFPIHNNESIQKHQTELKTIQNIYKKPIWFTEWGYTSTQNNLEKPWEHSNNCESCNACQQEGIQLFQKHFIQELQIEQHFYWKLFPPHIKEIDPCGYAIK